jgi:hypothetical protein
MRPLPLPLWTSATGTINDNDIRPTVMHHRLRLRDLVIQLYLNNPSAIDVDYTFVLANGTAGLGLYCTNVAVTVPAGATTGTVSVPTTAITIDENEDFSIASGTGLLLEQLIMTMAYCGNHL